MATLTAQVWQQITYHQTQHILFYVRTFQGSAIQCMADKAQIPSDVLNGYCWISSTFTLPKHFEVIG